MEHTYLDCVLEITEFGIDVRPADSFLYIGMKLSMDEAIQQVHEYKGLALHPVAG